jgi:hypothetical protein
MAALAFNQRAMCAAFGQDAGHTPFRAPNGLHFVKETTLPITTIFASFAVLLNLAWHRNADAKPSLGQLQAQQSKRCVTEVNANDVMASKFAGP